VVVIDTYEHVPTKPMDSLDNDLKPSQINGNRNVKEIEEALDYAGDDAAYEELEDDFFAKMIRAELEDNKKEAIHNKAKNQAGSKGEKQAVSGPQKEKAEVKPKPPPVQLT
jgi:hypothetical protein